MRARTRLRWAALTAVAGAAAWVGIAVAAPRPAPIPVSLGVDVRAPQGGDAVQVTARAKRLPQGDLIVIRILDSVGNADTVATCRTASCSGYWTEPDAATATFQAFVRTRAKGGRIAGKSSALQVTWSAAPPPPPPPPPPPAALRGHYCGLSNEGKSVCFDVSGEAGSAQVVRNVRMEANIRCSNGTGYWTLGTYPIPIDPSTLSFHFQYTGPLTVNGASNVNASYMLSGTFDTSGNVSGTVYLQHISWDENGTHYDCAGDPRTWTARLGA